MFDRGRRFIARRLGAALGVALLAAPAATAVASQLSDPGTSQKAWGAPEGLAAATPPFGAHDVSRAATGRKVLAVGDSWAATIAGGMESAGGPAVAVVDGTGAGCGIMTPGQPGPCGDWPTRWARDVEAQQPDAVLLMTAQWDLAPQDIDGDGRKVDITDPEFRQKFMDYLGKAIQILSAQGARVYVMNSKAEDDPTYRAQAIAMNTAIREVVGHETGRDVGMLDLYSQLCDRTGCPLTADDQPVYDDTGHLTQPFLVRIGAWVLDSMFPAPERT